jgi:hypothetical protein
MTVRVQEAETQSTVWSNIRKILDEAKLVEGDIQDVQNLVMEVLRDQQVEYTKFFEAKEEEHQKRLRLGEEVNRHLRDRLRAASQDLGRAQHKLYEARQRMREFGYGINPSTSDQPMSPASALVLTALALGSDDAPHVMMVDRSQTHEEEVQ